MSAIAFRSELPFAEADGWLARIRRAEPRFFGLALLMLMAMAPTSFAALVDRRDFLGIDVWIKPLKFEFALFVYFGTLALFALFLPAGTIGRAWYRRFADAVALATVAEMAWIGGASTLGTASHFNTSTVGAVIYPLMGIAAILLTSTTTVYAVQIARNPNTGLSPAVKEALVLGLALVLPLTLVTAGTMSGMGTHVIGGSTVDAAGVPIMGWSRDGGDLRVAHFFATHALHFIPAFGLVSATVFGGSRRAPVRIFAALFVAFVVFLFAQALMGRPLMS